MQREIESILPGAGAPVVHRAADLRYLGQEHTVTIALAGLADWPALRTQLDAAHQRAYRSAAPDTEVQLLNLPPSACFPPHHPRLPPPALPPTSPIPFPALTIYST